MLEKSITGGAYKLPGQKSACWVPSKWVKSNARRREREVEDEKIFVNNVKLCLRMPPHNEPEAIPLCYVSCTPTNTEYVNIVHVYREQNLHLLLQQGYKNT